MGSITVRKRKDGTRRYTAQIRIMKNGQAAYQESQTFDRKATAVAWLRRRETELYAPGGIEKAKHTGATVGEMIDRYLEQYGKFRPMGKTKKGTLIAIKNRWLGEVLDRDITSQKLIEYAIGRIESDHVTPQTVANDLAHLSAVLNVAKPSWGYAVDTSALTDAKKVLRKMGAVGRSRERNRRPTLDELERIFSYFYERSTRRMEAIDMLRVTAFALFSTRRQEEITRIRWDALNDKEQSALITDMKNPGQKYGNDVWCHLPDEAWRILQSMPKVADRIFPYNARTISSIFTRACHFLAIEGLCFHDLRHEGISWLFEMGWDIPKVSSVSGHRDWNSLRRYTHLKGNGNRYEGWAWLDKIIHSPFHPSNKQD